MRRVKAGAMGLLCAILAFALLGASASASAGTADQSGASASADQTASNRAGHQLNRLDASSYFDRFGPASNGEFVPWINEHISLLKAYPTFGDWYPARTTVPVIGAHDVYTAFTHEGTIPLTPAVRSEYVAAVERDKTVGYAGTFMDDINFQGGNKPPPEVQSEASYRSELANLIEAVRAALGPSAPIEINSQYHDIWPLMKVKEPEVERALSQVNTVTKEFGVGINSGIDTAADYKEFTEYVASLHQKGLHFVMAGDEKTVPGEEYNLATYFLVNDGGDYINQPEESPENWWPGNDIDLGSATSNGERTASGLWKREFTDGVVYTVEPGGESQTIHAPAGKHWLDVEGKEVSEVTLAPETGAVLRHALEAPVPPIGPECPSERGSDTDDGTGPHSGCPHRHRPHHPRRGEGGGDHHHKGGPDHHKKAGNDRRATEGRSSAGGNGLQKR